MNWDVLYRNRDGRQDTIQIEAEDRKALFKELARRGIAAIRVDKAKGGVKKSAPRTARRGGSVRWARVAVWAVVGAVAAVVLFVFKSTPPAKDGAARSDRKAARTTEAAPSDVSGSNAGDNETPKSAHDIAAEFSAQAKAFVKKAVTNETQWIVPPLDPKDPDNALRTRVCQELGSLLSIEPGEPMPPFPYSFLLEDDMRQAAAAGEDVGEIDNGNKAFLESLAKYKIVAKETDDAHRLAHKERLIAAQGELLDSMGEGFSVNDTIRAAYEFRKQAYETRTELCGLLTEIAREGDTDIKIFKEQLEIANARLKEQGIKEIPLEEILPDYEDGDAAHADSLQNKEDTP